jgi:hypothetical protein
MGNWTAGHSGKRLFRLLALGATLWSMMMSRGARHSRACYRGGRAVFWNPPLDPTEARYLGKTRKWKLISRDCSEPVRPMQVAFAGRSWIAGRGPQLKPTDQRSRHQAQLETRGGQIRSICAIGV